MIEISVSLDISGWNLSRIIKSRPNYRQSTLKNL
jgi:hypothetical protein